jgi:hypothetical protein
VLPWNKRTMILEGKPVLPRLRRVHKRTPPPACSTPLRPCGSFRGAACSRRRKV